MPFQFELENGNPTVQINSFLVQLEKLFIDMVYENRVLEQAIRFIGDMHSHLRAALEEDTIPHFGRLRNAVEEVKEGEWRRVGLTGASLKAKLAALMNLGQRIREGIVDALRYLLAQINSLLGSISAATGGLADLISEFKDMVENCIDYVSDGG